MRGHPYANANRPDDRLLLATNNRHVIARLSRLDRSHTDYTTDRKPSSRAAFPNRLPAGTSKRLLPIVVPFDTHTTVDITHLDPPIRFDRSRRDKRLFSMYA